jgi:hypothetical protein
MPPQEEGKEGKDRPCNEIEKTSIETLPSDSPELQATPVLNFIYAWARSGIWDVHAWF